MSHILEEKLEMISNDYNKNKNNFTWDNFIKYSDTPRLTVGLKYC